MKWASDIDPTLDSYPIAEQDRIVVAQMLYRNFVGDDLIDVSAMLFGPMSPAKVRS